MYGAVLFNGQIKRQQKYLFKSGDRPVFVGINRDSVHILSTASPPVNISAFIPSIIIIMTVQEVLLHEPLDRLCWEFQACDDEGEDFYSSLWLEYETMVPADTATGAGESKVFKMLQIFSRQAPMMEALLEQSWKYFEQERQL